MQLHDIILLNKLIFHKLAPLRDLYYMHLASKIGIWRNFSIDNCTKIVEATE